MGTARVTLVGPILNARSYEVDRATIDRWTATRQVLIEKEDGLVIHPFTSVMEIVYTEDK